MGTYTRLGSSLLVSELARDPLGILHRGVLLDGGTFDRHVTVRSFSEELLHAGLGAQLDEARKVAALLDGMKAIGLGCRIESGKAPHIAWDHVPGRSLAQLIEKAKQEQIHFGVEHALTVIQGLALGLVQMKARGVGHGLISPHSVWVGFDGSIQLLDAPFASLAKSLLAKAPSAGQKLAPYLPGSDGDAFQQDLFALGAVFYELLTFERLPGGADLQIRLDQMTLKAAQEESPVPAATRAFLARLLRGSQPFTSVEAFSMELEHVLYEGDCSPSTFGLAFLMHTLFREEKDREAAAVKAELNEGFVAETPVAEPVQSEPLNMAPLGISTEAPPARKNAMLIGVGLVAVVVLGLGYYFFGRPRTEPAPLKPQEEPKGPSVKAEPQKAVQEKKSPAEAPKAEAPKQQGETRPPEEKPKIQKPVDAAQQRLLDLERQQKAAEQRLEELRKKEQMQAEQK
jgi:hypothetical protein